MLRRLAALPAIAVTATALGSCVLFAPPVDLKQAVQVTDVSTGWFDAGIVAGKNKLVPSVTFKLKKNAGVKLSSVSLNVSFVFVGDTDPNEDVYVQHIAFEGLETAPIPVRSKVGFTADPPQTRVEMLKHSEFRDMEARIFAKQSSSQWIELKRVRIERQLLTQ
jgi:hypothetical protein